MKYASARAGAFSDTPIYDHVAWLLEQQYLSDAAADQLSAASTRIAHESFDSKYAPVDSYYPGYDTYSEYSGGGRHRAYAA